MDALQVAFSLAGVVIVIFGCYYVTYFFSRKASGQGRSKIRIKGRHISLLERFAISKDKSFCIVEVAGKIYVLGVTNNSITVIDTLDPDVFAQLKEEQSDSPSWHMMQGGLGGRLANRLSSFIVGRFGKSGPAGTAGGAESGSFARSMEAAREKDISGSPDRNKAQRGDSPEGEE